MGGTIENAAGTFWLDDEGLLRCTVKGGNEQTREVAEDSMRIFKDLAAGRRRAVVLDLPAGTRLSRGARACYTGASAAEVFAAVALVTAGSALTRTLVNFVVAVGKPTFPTRMFDTVDDALAWAREHRNKR